MSSTSSVEQIGRLLAALLHPSSLIELAATLACLALAWAMVGTWRRARGLSPGADSIWFGRRVVDGVLFPLAALALALLARWFLREQLAIAVFKLVVPILGSLALIRLAVRVLHRAYPASDLMRIVERSLSWVAWIAVALWVTGLLPVVLQELDGIRWNIGTASVSLRNLIEGTVTAVLVLVLALSVSAAIETQLLNGAVDNISVRKMAANAMRALLLFVGLMVALSAAGIDLTALGVLGGALGVGLGFGLQKLAANYVSGFVILAERSMRIGDTVKVDNFEGRITDIKTRYTVIRALNGREAIVPNEMLITQRVENSSLADPEVLLTTTVQVAYGTDVDDLMPLLSAAVVAVPRVLTEKPPAVHLTNFAADGLELTVAFWIADPQNGTGNVRSAVNLAILRTLNAAGVEIPFPQRVLRTPAGDALAAAPAGTAVGGLPVGRPPAAG